METTIQATAHVSPILRAGGDESAKTSHQERPDLLSKDQIDHIVKQMNKVVESSKTHLAFSVDATTKRTVVSVVDTSTGEQIRQIPPEDVLEVSRRIARLFGVLIDEAA